jgi:nicotinamide-nucleotide amidase
MRRSILFVGENIKNNKPFRTYLYREIEKKIQTFENIHFIVGKDNSLFLIIEEMVDKYDEIIIATIAEEFNLIGKIISTLTNDSLVLKSDEQMLIPSKSSVYTKDSFLLEHEGTYINVISVQENEQIAEILINYDEHTIFFNLLDTPLHLIKEYLLPQAESFECDIKTTNITPGVTLVKVKSKKYGQLPHLMKNIKMHFSDHLIENRDLFEYIAKKLILHKQTITFAESCTGGLCASEFTKFAGVSEIFSGSLVTYSNEMKEAWLGVAPGIFANYGAVSEECIKEMLDGAIDIANSDFAIAISGIAGPGGGSVDKPVGTIYVGAKSKESATIIEKIVLKGDRQYIQYQAALFAMKLLINTNKKIFL